MTTHTLDIGGVGGIGYDRRHMGLMTDTAIGLSHLGGMGLMALDAFGDHPMTFGMAIGTGQRRMFADVGVQLGFLGIMAGQAGRRQTVGQRDFEGPVRIMATRNNFV